MSSGIRMAVFLGGQVAVVVRFRGNRMEVMIMGISSKSGSLVLIHNARGSPTARIETGELTKRLDAIQKYASLYIVKSPELFEKA
jgi:hypothetical protein